MDEVWKSRMDLLASEKETSKVELSSVENQLQVAKDKADKWSQLNDDLRAQLSSVVAEWDVLGMEYEALKSKLDTTSVDAEEMVAQYKADVEASKTRLKTKDEYVKWLSWRETLKEIHARGFDLSAKIKESKTLAIEAKELYEHEGVEGSKGSEGSDGSSDESSPDEDQA
ncbi:uncharacterized protein [Nicotiana sylvestris]|uniref:uncharacterized protein n=1 Tax=Nicotiana sylvestris TaxID=4096 RepID=UPI00388C4DCC